MPLAVLSDELLQPDVRNWGTANRPKGERLCAVMPVILTAAAYIGITREQIEGCYNFCGYDQDGYWHHGFGLAGLRFVPTVSRPVRFCERLRGKLETAAEAAQRSLDSGDELGAEVLQYWADHPELFPGCDDDQSRLRHFNEMLNVGKQGGTPAFEQHDASCRCSNPPRSRWPHY